MEDIIREHLTGEIIFRCCGHSRWYEWTYTNEIFGEECLCDGSICINVHKTTVPCLIYQYCGKDQMFGECVYTGNPDSVVLVEDGFSDSWIHNPATKKWDICPIKYPEYLWISAKMMLTILKNLPKYYINPPDPVPEDSIRIMYNS